MNITTVSNQEDLTQEQVCCALRDMDRKLRTMMTLILQTSDEVEAELVLLLKDNLLDVRKKSSSYYGNIVKYALPILKLTKVKNINLVLSIISDIELTRDITISIVEKFVKKAGSIVTLTEQLTNISNSFYDINKDNNSIVYAEEYNRILNEIYKIEYSIKGLRRDSLYGAILNILDIKEQYYEIRNSIVMAYTKLNLGMACRSVQSIQVEDSFQNGVLGIIRAIDKSRVGKLEAKVASFVNFVRWHIKNSIASMEFNTRTDIVFNIPLKQIPDEETFKKLKGEQFIDAILEDTNLIYTPEYQDSFKNNLETVLDDEEQSIIALLHGDPSGCRFEKYPTQDEIAEEIKKQLFYRNN